MIPFLHPQLIHHPKRLFILSGPAGAGKTTLASMLMNEFSSTIALHVSYTTRPPRLFEKEGVDYHFISIECFKEKIERGEFLEYVHLHGNYYGSSHTWIQHQQDAGKHILMVLDIQGAAKIKDLYPQSVSIFIAPPSQKVLLTRLSSRGTEHSESLKQRLELAQVELKEQKSYDYVFINDQLDHSYMILKSIIVAEFHRSSI